ncbi:hypothetical protein EK599_04605 [Vibrio sp. T187]|uniref:hypothetical protein n=1 Tax=Vibrio TaxID=662 RepID=UPI0010CA1B1A|nr:MULTISPECIES: hypothetical protein [Vibrio]MBW3694960.1 hypothetical protein [Vibrio sp. T187]
MRYLTLFLCLFCTISYADPHSITLKLPAVKDNIHLYYHELLQRSLALIGVELVIEIPTEHIPQKRMVKMVEKDQLSLIWLIQTDERDKKYGYIDVPLTNGLIGHRVLLIPKGSQRYYQSISDLSELQKSGLVGGLGMNWYDEKVWKANDLPVYIQDGEWRALYEMLSGSGEVNYFPRGVTEVVNEALFNPQLEIEKSLLLVYERDFRFYLSESATRYQPVLERALQHARKTGLIDEMVAKYWRNDFEELQIDSRTRIELRSP